MNQERIFTEEELQDMGTRTMDLIERAIELGDIEKAKKLVKRMYTEGLLMHDIYVDWITMLLSFIGRRYGDDILYQAFKESIGEQADSMMDMDENADIRKRVQRFVFLLRGHGQPMEIKEDKEKVVIKMKPCGSGERQILAGKYEPPQNFLKVKKSQPMTSWKEDYPVYCCHDHFITSSHVARGCSPVVMVVASDKPGEEPCEIWLYKDPESIPPEAYRKAGVER